MTLPFIAIGTSMVVCLWIESLLLLVVWSEGETLPRHIPYCCSSQGFSQGHVLSGLHPYSRIAIWSALRLIFPSVADSLHSPSASSSRMAFNITASLSSTCVQSSSLKRLYSSSRVGLLSAAGIDFQKRSDIVASSQAISRIN